MTHYIPNTNNKYSITEEGVVTMHYKYNNVGKIRYVDSIMNNYNHNNLQIIKITFSSGIKTTTTSALIFETFGYTKCKDCNCKIYKTIRNKQCDNCKKIYSDNYNYLSTHTITKSYSADKLSIPVSILSDKLHQLHKQQLQIKRLIKSKQNGS